MDGFAIGYYAVAVEYERSKHRPGVYPSAGTSAMLERIKRFEE
jgi:hypothetical protein